MSLSDIKVKSAKLPDGKRQLHLSDGGGLYLQVTPTGKYWRMNYRFCGKQKTLAIGVYSRVSLKEARGRREVAKKQLEKNVNPSQHKQKEKWRAIAKSHAATFEAIARELLRAIDAFEGTLVVKCALRMMPYVFTRPGELHRAGWNEIDFEKAEWRIPAH